MILCITGTIFTFTTAIMHTIAIGLKQQAKYPKI